MHLENLEPQSPSKPSTIQNELELAAPSEPLRKDRFLSDGNILLPDHARMWNELEDKPKKQLSPFPDFKGSPAHDPLRTNKKSQRMQQSPLGPDHKTKSGKKAKRQSEEESKDGLGELLDMHRRLP